MDLQKTKQRIEEILDVLRPASGDTYYFENDLEFERAYGVYDPFTEFVCEIADDTIIKHNEKFYRVSLNHKGYMKEVFPHLKVIKVFV